MTRMSTVRLQIAERAGKHKGEALFSLHQFITEELLMESYKTLNKNSSAGVDGEDWYEYGKNSRERIPELMRRFKAGEYKAPKIRKAYIPKGDGNYRPLGIPTVNDRVAQQVIKSYLEPRFEAQFSPQSYGYRPKRTAHQAIERVAEAVVKEKTRVIDLDLRAYFDTVKHHILLDKVAKRIADDKIMRLLNQMLKAGGKEGVPQGGVISPVLSNIYLNEVDKMLEKAKETTREGKYTHLEYARFADDVVILVDGHHKWDWLWAGINKRLREELNKLQVHINEEKTKQLDLVKGDSFGFLGFDFRRLKTKTGKWRVNYQPKMQARIKMMDKIRDVFKRHESQPLTRVRDLINPIVSLLRILGYQ